MKFVSACMKFFGRRKDENLHEFLAECKQLTPEDRTELKPLLEKEIGETIEDEPKA
jgi:hypothetical protein